MRTDPPTGRRPAALARSTSFVGLLAIVGLLGVTLAQGSPASADGARASAPADESPGMGASGESTAASSAAASSVRPTAIAVDVPVAPKWTRGVDDSIHLDYDLLTTNWVPGTVTLTSVEVLSLQGQVLLTLAGDDLTAATHLVSNATPTSAVPEAATVATIIDVVLPSPGDRLRSSAVPATLTHRVSYTLPDDVEPAVRVLVESLQVLGPETRVDRSVPTTIAPPLRGPRWVNAVGCCEPTALHRRLLYTANGQWIKGEEFAIDWLRLDDTGAPYSGDGSAKEDWYDYGTPVLSVADGVVVRAVDGRQDIEPGDAPILPDADSFSGNYVVVKIRSGVYAQFAHLQEGSVAVSVGDRVRAGRQLGLLGNSGNSTAPHLHFGLIDEPDFTIADSLPWVFDRFAFTGYVDFDTGTITGNPHPSRREYPLLTSLVDLG